MKLFDSELRLMDLIWDRGGRTARELCLLAQDRFGWNKNTTYTVLKKLVAKNAVERTEPGFRCTALITREAVAREETAGLIQKLYGGSRKAFFAAFLQEEALSNAELDELRAMIEGHEE